MVSDSVQTILQKFCWYSSTCIARVCQSLSGLRMRLTEVSHNCFVHHHATLQTLTFIQQYSHSHKDTSHTLHQNFYSNFMCPPPPTCQCISSGSSQYMRASLTQASRTISEPPALIETQTDTPQSPSSRPTPINAQHFSTICTALWRKIWGQTLLECYQNSV